MQHASRITIARRRARVTRYAIGVTAAVALAAFAAAARASHPGSHPGRAGDATAVTSSYNESSSSSFFDGGSSIGPSGSASSQLQSGGS